MAAHPRREHRGHLPGVRGRAPARRAPGRLRVVQPRGGVPPGHGRAARRRAGRARTRCTASARCSARHSAATTSTGTASRSRVCGSAPSPRRRPDVRALSTWLSPADCARLVDAALRSADAHVRDRLGRLGEHPPHVGSPQPARRSATSRRTTPRRTPRPCPTPSRTRPTRSSAAGSRPTASASTRCWRDHDTHDDVRAWIADEVDPAAAAELQALLDAGDDAELADRFSGPLTFGTAGLRGPLRAGPNGMNRTVVRRAAAGLAAWLLDQGRAGAAGRRRLRRAARIPRFRKGFRRDLRRRTGSTRGCCRRSCRRPSSPTPCSTCSAAAGVMVTASHNPPQDNGYKVYTADGAQIVPPADREIEAAIRAVGPAREIPLDPDGGDACSATTWRTGTSPPSPALAADGPARPDDGLHRDARRRLRRSCSAVLAAAGFAPLLAVPEQDRPDPEFPTVAFPNPEEPGALDLALALARDRDADLVLANDPDADRCAVAVPRPDGRVADAARRRGRRAARGCPAAEGDSRHLRDDDRVVVDARRARREARRRLRRDPHRVQVDLARCAGPRVRLRGGARLRRRAGPRPRQGRHQRRAARRRARRRAEGGRLVAAASGWTSSPPSTAATPPTRSRCASTTSPTSPR